MKFSDLRYRQLRYDIQIRAQQRKGRLTGNTVPGLTLTFESHRTGYACSRPIGQKFPRNREEIAGAGALPGKLYLPLVVI